MAEKKGFIRTRKGLKTGCNEYSLGLKEKQFSDKVWGFKPRLDLIERLERQRREMGLSRSAYLNWLVADYFALVDEKESLEKSEKEVEKRD